MDGEVGLVSMTISDGKNRKPVSMPYRSVAGILGFNKKRRGGLRGTKLRENSRVEWEENERESAKAPMR